MHGTDSKRLTSGPCQYVQGMADSALPEVCRSSHFLCKIVEITISEGATRGALTGASMFHCSFDIVKDGLGGPRSVFPHSLYFVAATQADMSRANYVAFIRVDNLTQVRMRQLASRMCR